MTDAGRLFGRGYAFPPRLDGEGRMAFSEGPENIRQTIRVILLTEPRERVMLPAFGAGLKRFLYEPNTVTTRRRIQEAISRSLGRWEPRIRLESVAVEADPDDPRSALATIRYQLVATGASDRVETRLRFER